MEPSLTLIEQLVSLKGTLMQPSETLRDNNRTSETLRDPQGHLGTLLNFHQILRDTNGIIWDTLEQSWNSQAKINEKAYGHAGAMSPASLRLHKYK